MGYVADKIIERRQEKEQKELEQSKKDFDERKLTMVMLSKLYFTPLKNTSTET